MNTAICSCCFGVIIEDFVIPLVLKTTSELCTTEFESNKICEDFLPKNKDDYFQCA